MNNGNNNQSKNYVTPEKVDLNKVVVNTNNQNALNRERDNIISASIQANQAIDENKAADVNRTIKVKKKNPIVSLLIGLFFIGFSRGFLSFLGFKLLQDYIKKDDAKYTTTTTTTQKVNNFEKYIFNSNKLRKFQNNDTILILLPTLSGNVSKYVQINISTSGILKKEEGTYNIQNRLVSLVSNEGNYSSYNIGESSLSIGESTLNMFDQEVKYYIKKGDLLDSVLIVNGTADNNFAYLYDETYRGFYDYTETKTDITLSNGMVFLKNGLDLTYLDQVYTYGE